jgi:hypothetical protein
MPRFSKVIPTPIPRFLFDDPDGKNYEKVEAPGAYSFFAAGFMALKPVMPAYLRRIIISDGFAWSGFQSRWRESGDHGTGTY